MDNVNGQTFGPQEMVETDGRAFTDCTFESANIVYRGGEHPSFERCTFNGNVNWHFLGPALKTIQLLQRLANDQGGENFIGALFQKGIYFADEGAVAS